MHTHIFTAGNGAIYARGDGLRDLRRLAAEYALTGVEYVADNHDRGESITGHDADFLFSKGAVVAALGPHWSALRPPHRDPITRDVLDSLTQAVEWFTFERDDVARERRVHGEAYAWAYVDEIAWRADLANRCRPLLRDIESRLTGAIGGVEAPR